MFVITITTGDQHYPDNAIVRSERYDTLIAARTRFFAAIGVYATLGWSVNKYENVNVHKKSVTMTCGTGFYHIALGVE